MSELIIQDEGYAAIFADPQLKRARTKLSLHEIRLIVKHAREGYDRATPSPQPGGKA